MVKLLYDKPVSTESTAADEYSTVEPAFRLYTLPVVENGLILWLPPVRLSLPPDAIEKVCVADPVLASMETALALIIPVDPILIEQLYGAILLVRMIAVPLTFNVPFTVIDP